MCRLVAVGVGNPLRRDDAVGVLIAELVGHPCVVPCAYGLELCMHRLRRLKPRELLVIDATLDLKPCECVVTVPNRVRERRPSSHNVPLSIAARLLNVERVAILAVGVSNVDVGYGVSEPILKCARVIASWLKSLFEMCGHECRLENLYSAYSGDAASPCLLDPITGVCEAESPA